MEINKFSQPASISSTKSNIVKTAGTGEHISATITESSQAKISRDFEVLSQAQQTLNTIPEINLENIAQVQLSIKDGTFNIDLEQIAEAMHQQHALK